MENAKKVAKIEINSDETHLLLYVRVLHQLRHSFRAQNMQSLDNTNMLSELQQYHHHHSYVELLTEKQLSMAIYALQTTMERLCGRDSPRPRPITKLPHSLFSDYSESGAVVTILALLLREMLRLDDREGERFKQPSDLFTQGRGEISALLVLIERTLTSKGLLSYPRVFLSRAPEQHVERLSSIIVSHGGSIVSTEEAATHVVEWNDEVDSLPEQLVEDYIRIVDIKHDKTARVHWWYHPDCYDELLPHSEVDTHEPPDMSALYPLQRDKWFICCRFIFDCELFNEWGNELDYEHDNSQDAAVVTNHLSSVGGEAVMGMGIGGSAAKKSRGRKKLGSLSSSSSSSSLEQSKQLLLSNDLPVIGAIVGTEKLMLNAIPLSTTIASSKDLLPPTTTASATASTTATASATTATASATAATVMQVSSLSNPNNIHALQSTEGAVLSTIGVKRSSIELNDPIIIPDSMHVPMLFPNPEGISAPPPSSATAAVDSTSSSSSSSSSSHHHRNPHLPLWFDQHAVSAVELKLLGDVCRINADEYLVMRNTMVNLYEQNGLQYITGTECRRRIPGDVCKVLRIFEFLTSFGLINYNCRSETRSAADPTTILHATDDYRDLIKQKSSRNDDDADATEALTSRWTTDADNSLLLSVRMSYVAMNDNSRSSSSSKHGVDWSSVATLMNSSSSSAVPAGCSNVTALECATRFIEMDLTEQPFVNLRPSLLRKELLPVRDTCTTTSADKTDVLRLIKSLSQSTSQDQSELKSAYHHLLQEHQTTARAKSHQLMSELVSEYLQTKLSILSEKVALLSDIETSLSTERIHLCAEKADLQILRAQKALGYKM